jgi:hypothetical protein
VEFNTVADVIVAFESYALLVFVVGVQWPELHCAVCRCCGYVRSICTNLPTHGMEANVYNSICMPLELSSQLAIWNAPDSTNSAPSWCCKELFIRWDTSSWNTTIVSVLRFLNSIGPNSIDEFFEFIQFRLHFV